MKSENYVLSDYEMMRFQEFRAKAMEYETLFCEEYHESPSYKSLDDIGVSLALCHAIAWYDDAIDRLKNS